MKKWMYLIFPGLMLGVFLIFYFAHVDKMHEKERQVAQKIAKEKSEAEAKKKQAEAKAREDAKKRQEERDAEEKKKTDERAAKQAAEDKKVRDAIAEYTAKAEAATKQLTALEAELAGIRKDKDQTSREAFEIAKQVELARIARRNAELEIQRMIEIVSLKAADSAMAKPPVIPAAAPAKK